MFRDDKKRAKALAKIIKSHRKKKSWSQETLAQKINVSAETIRKIEQNKTSSPGVFVIADLAHVLNLQMHKIVGSPGGRG